MRRLGNFLTGGQWTIWILFLGLAFLFYGCNQPSKVLIAPEEGPITPPSQTPPNLEETSNSSLDGSNTDPMAPPEMSPETSDGEVSSPDLPDPQVYQNPDASASEPPKEPLPEHANVKVP